MSVRPMAPGIEKVVQAGRNAGVAERDLRRLFDGVARIDYDEAVDLLEDTQIEAARARANGRRPRHDPAKVEAFVDAIEAQIKQQGFWKTLAAFWNDAHE